MPDIRSVLLIDGDPEDANAVREALSDSDHRALEVVLVRSRAAALERLAVDAEAQTRGAERFAAILVDLFLPDSAGIETFDRLFAAAPQIPILVLSTPDHEAIAQEAVRRGAQDYLLTSRLDGYLLPRALGGMIDRAANAEALFEERDRAQVTLNSIGDAVISCDIRGRVTYLNLAAEKLTGWARGAAAGLPLEEMFQILDAYSGESRPNPLALAIRENRTIALKENSILKRRDGAEAAIEDSAAPIHDRRGKVTGAVMVFHDVTDARALAMKMSHQAQHDILTDLPNRMLLNDRLTHAMAVADRRKQKLAVLFLDIDHFKNVNDTLGHEVGDRLLRMVADQLLGSVRNSDTVSRQGGDEFVIVLSELNDGHDAAIAAEKILQTLSAPFQIEAHELHVSASIGIVIYPDDARDAETLLRHADFAMYHAKDCGRGNFQFFREDMNVRALERRSVESGLRGAVEKSEFVLHYQPIVDLWSGATTGIEALLRWQHPIRGLLPPAEFVPIAEESGLIVPIGRWVLREACRQSRAWQAAGMAPVSIAINISAVELRDKDFAATVRAVLQESGLAPRYLELELTETFLLKDSSATALVLRELKDLGVRLSLDDFGTGYSSFSHLKGFPIDTLKIDRAFVSDVDSSCNDASIVGAVIALGKNLHMRVIAEGVETRAQLTLLQDQACPEGQGFYFGRAVAGEHVPALLSKIQTDLHSLGKT